jgi:prephenate dehydratase
MRKQVAYLGPKGTYAEKAAHILSKLANTTIVMLQ